MRSTAVIIDEDSSEDEDTLELMQELERIKYSDLRHYFVWSNHLFDEWPNNPTGVAA